MDPFTQRMLERARARQEKIDQKLASSGRTPKRKPLSENLIQSNQTETIIHKKQPETIVQKQPDTIIQSKLRNSDVDVEINIMHRDDIQIEVQVEERDVPMSVIYETDSGSCAADKHSASPLKITATKQIMDKENSSEIVATKQVMDKENSGLRQNVKSRLDRLGILYSDKAELSSPIHRTELEFSSATPPPKGAVCTPRQPPKDGKKKFGRLAALADQINNWEDDLSHHLERAGYRRVSTSQSRLVYDFSTPKFTDHDRQEPKGATTPGSTVRTANMAAVVTASPPTKPPIIAKKPSITHDESNENSPVVKRMVPKVNGNADRNSVLSKAAMFEAGSPRAKEKDPAEMSLRERKALFEKNKGTVILPKAPFGMAPPLKSLHGENKESKPFKHQVTKSGDSSKTASPCLTPTRSAGSNTSSKENLEIDTQKPSGIRGKLAALLTKEQTISESTISNKFKQEREREMEMLQNRFQYKSKHVDSDDEDHVHGEHAPLMGSQSVLDQVSRKPEIIANIPKVTFDKEQEPRTEADGIVSSQPNKKRSSQDSPVVLAVLDDVKRIKVNNKQPESTQQGLYPHLSDIETDNSNTHEEYSECGGSSSVDEENTDDCEMYKSDDCDITVSDDGEHSKDVLNKSDDWAETSLGREVMKVHKVQKRLRTETKPGKQTPPKQNKQATVSSNSFKYERGSPVKKQFKSPLKTQPPSTPKHDKGSELVHSVSFYRRMQNASSTPTTPLRVVRHISPERVSEEPQPAVTVRQRIKELQAEVSKQQTIISQASQALNLCASTVEFSGSTEQAEGERLLLLATHRRQACLHEIQRLQVEGAGVAAQEGMASLHIQGISVPLKREYIRQINADGAVGHHAVCLLKCRDRVLATSMQQTKPSTNILHFPDEIRMEGVNSDFKVTMEVHLLQASKEVLPHNVKYHISNKKSSSKLLTPKGKVSELKAPKVQSPAGPNAVRSPQFQGHGYCIFALQQANRNHFTLNKLPPSSPLEGSISVNISARVLLPPPSAHCAFLTEFDDVNGLGAWHRRWFVLQTSRLTYWKYPDDVQKKMPIGDIDLTTVLSEKAVRAPRDLCARQNTILIESSVPAGLIVQDSGSLVYSTRPDGTVVRRHLLAADTPQDRDKWIDSINKALEYVRCMPSSD